MKALLQFRDDQLALTDFGGVECACPEELRQKLKDFEFSLLKHCYHPLAIRPPDKKEASEESNEPKDEELPSMLEKLITKLLTRQEKKVEVATEPRPGWEIR